MTRRTRDRIILCINFLLIIALTFSIFTIAQKTKDLNNAQKQIEHKQSAIENQSVITEELESELEKSRKNAEKVQSELDNIKKEKKKLEKENSSLKKQLELKKKAGNNSGAVVNTDKSTVPQNPKPQGKVCYLTFDDGPTANTLKILKVLEKYDVKATFFVINTPQSKIEYVKQIHAAGHTVGLHSNSHNYAQIYSSKAAYFADLKKISDIVKKYTGVESKVIRFPGGGSNSISRNYCKGIMTELSAEVTKKGYTYFDWNVDSCDASDITVSTTKIVNNVVNNAKDHSSICVLMHDSSSKTTTVEALPKIIENLKKQGYTFKALTPDSYGYHHSVLN